MRRFLYKRPFSSLRVVRWWHPSLSFSAPMCVRKSIRHCPQQLVFWPCVLSFFSSGRIRSYWCNDLYIMSNVALILCLKYYRMFRHKASSTDYSERQSVCPYVRLDSLLVEKIWYDTKYAVIITNARESFRLNTSVLSHAFNTFFWRNLQLFRQHHQQQARSKHMQAHL